MNKQTILGLGLTALLTLSAATAFAADKKENLPKKTESEQKTVQKAPQKAPAKSSKTTTSRGGSDRFVDDNQNGVNDRGERKVRRPPTSETSSTIKAKPPKSRSTSTSESSKSTARQKPKTPPRRR